MSFQTFMTGLIFSLPSGIEIKLCESNPRIQSCGLPLLAFDHRLINLRGFRDILVALVESPKRKLDFCGIGQPFHGLAQRCLRRILSPAQAQEVCQGQPGLLVVGKGLQRLSQYGFCLIDCVALIMKTGQFHSMIIDRGFFLDYLAQHPFRRPVVTSRNVVAVTFDKDSEVVKTVDTMTLKDGKVIAFNGRETPTRGRQLTILEQLLGNVGRGQLPHTDDEDQPGQRRPD